MDNVERGKDKPAFEVTDNSITCVLEILQITHEKYGWARNNGDPRNYSRFNKESRLKTTTAARPTTIALQTKRRENMP